MRIVGYVLSVIGVLIFAAAVIAGLYLSIERFLSSSEPENFVPMNAAVAMLAGAFGIALRIIGKQLSGFGGVVFPRIRAYLTSGPVVVIEIIAAVALWGMSAWFGFYLFDRIMTKPYSQLGFDFLLGIPFGILIPLAAGFSLYAASRIPAVPADANAPPPPEAVRLLGNALTVFGIFWLLFAGSCTWTGGFNPSGPNFDDPELVQNAIISFIFGAIAVATGVGLRRIAHMPVPS